jgi:clathrin heavy chain
MWRELHFLYVHYEEFDNAAMTQILHPAEAWDHNSFKDTIIKVSNVDMYSRAITFYLAFAPSQLNDLLNHLATPTVNAASRLEHNKVANMLRKEPGYGPLGMLPLVQKYFEGVQKVDMKEVNEAVNDIYIELENTESLRLSVDTYPNFDQVSGAITNTKWNAVVCMRVPVFFYVVCGGNLHTLHFFRVSLPPPALLFFQIALAQKLQKHDLLELRRVSAYIFKTNKRYPESVALSKADKLYDDVMATAAESRDT